MELETTRPSFNCDLPCMDPTMPMMQFKVYPKYRYKVNNAIMLRHEIIAGSFFKEFGKTSPDSLPLSMKVLSNPEYCRETAERLLQLELYLNGQEGLGYNERFKEPEMNEYVTWFNEFTMNAIFGKKAANYEAEYQMFLDTGKIPTSIPLHFRKKMAEMQLDKFMHRVLAKINDNTEDEP